AGEDALGHGVGEALEDAQGGRIRRGLEAAQHGARLLADLAVLCLVAAREGAQDGAEPRGAQDLFADAIRRPPRGADAAPALALRLPEERRAEPPDLVRIRCVLAREELAQDEGLAGADDDVLVVRGELRERAELARELGRTEHEVVRGEADP